MGEALPAHQSGLHSHSVINASLAAYSASLHDAAGTADVGQLQHVETVCDVAPAEYCAL